MVQGFWGGRVGFEGMNTLKGGGEVRWFMLGPQMLTLIPLPTAGVLILKRIHTNFGITSMV
jgi:hypothetical protein